MRPCSVRPSNRVNRSIAFSLLELLIVVAIIAILMSMYLDVFGKLRQKVNTVVAQEGLHQQKVSTMADTGPSLKLATKAQCRAVYRVAIGKDQYVSRVNYWVTTDEEFRAYYHALLDLQNDKEPEYEGNHLVAVDPVTGNEHRLLPVSDAIMNKPTYGFLPVAWEFYSTHPEDMNRGDYKLEVLYADGRIVLIAPPNEFPFSQVVAELSHEFAKNTAGNG